MHTRSATMTLLAVSLLGLTAAPATLAVTDSPVVPNWSAACADGQDIDFHETLSGGPVVLSFWATWCPPCLVELPHLDELQQKYEGRVAVLAVNIDESSTLDEALELLRKREYRLRVPLDTTGEIRSALQVGSPIPFVLVYDRDGNEIYSQTGYAEGDEKELELQVRALLGEG